jgi:hypothetical protein
MALCKHALSVCIAVVDVSFFFLLLCVRLCVLVVFSHPLIPPPDTLRT